MSTRSLRLVPASLLAFLFVLVSSLSASAHSLSDAHERHSAALAPARPYRVALQVGHYKNNELPPSLSSLSGHTGAYGGGRSELELNLDVANRSARLLRAQGVIVDILPATVPTGYTADAFVALHADGNSSPAARGFKISTRWRSKIAVQDYMLVDMLTDSYRAATALPEDSNVTRNMRGYYAYSPWRPDYRVSNFTPSAIVEMGFVTSAADRAVMFNETGKLASGVVSGILAFLKSAYGPSPGSRAYGYGLVDPDINKPTPAPGPRTGASSPPSRQSKGNWQVLLMGSKPTINVYAKSGGGTVLAQLPKGNFHHSIFRDGDYYRITLPNGQEGWIHRNALIVQM
ncbi:MAG TPA: N-acetylmuramoyl-L-alanine amidase [Chloroflexia bacterium]|jgi:hypothetical protein